MLRDVVRLRIGFRVRGNSGRAARRADGRRPAGKAAREPEWGCWVRQPLAARLQAREIRTPRQSASTPSWLQTVTMLAKEGRAFASRYFDHPLGDEWIERHDRPASVNSLPGQFPNELPQIGGPPPTGEIPSNSCAVAMDSVEAVVTDRDIVEKLRLPNERGERIQFKISKIPVDDRPTDWRRR